MAGLEVAGVVIGSIPLVISALEHYGDGVRVMKNMVAYECVFEDFRTQLETSVGIYMNSCYQLLGPLNLSDDKMKDLLLNRNAQAWSDPDLQKAIANRLGDNYKRYVSAVKNLDKRISLFCRKLKLDDQMKPPWIDQNSSVDEIRRKKFFKSSRLKIRGGFDTDKHAALLADIDRDIDKIARLTRGSIELEPLRAEKKNRLQSVYWQSIRDQAQRLFESLSSRFCPCDCTHPHKANLRLDVRKSRTGDDTTARFAFLLTFEKSVCGPHAVPWSWRDIEIECSQCSSSQTYISTSQTPQVHFAPSITLSAAQLTSPSPSPSLAAKIDNLCRTLIDDYEPEGCLGVLEDEPWQQHVYSVVGPASQNLVSDSASLKELISGNGPIAPRQKSILALTLASSVLQLHDTPWLPRSWDTRDIFILKGHSGTPLLSQFYVSRTFTSAAAVNAAITRQRLVKNEMVFALGVALLELAYGLPITSFVEDEDLNEEGKEDSMTKVSIATRLAHQLNMRESENYARAVLRCVKCSFDTFASDFDDAEFREKFYEGVVVPLQEDFEYVTGGRKA